MKRGNAEKIYLAIGEIDESLIEEATTPITQKNKAAQRIIAAAACATIITAGVLVSANLFNYGVKNESSPDFEYAPGISGGNNSDNNASPAPDYYPEDSESGKSEIIKIQSFRREGNIFSFVLYVNYSASNPININLYSEDGIIIYSTDESISTLFYTPVILVDGEVSKLLPTKEGKYTVDVIFGEDSLELPSPDNGESIPDADKFPLPNVNPTDIFVIESMGEILFCDSE